MSTCNALWSHVRLSVEGTVLPCCKWQHNKGQKKHAIPQIKDGVLSAIHSEYFDDVRQRMNNNEVIPECNACNQLDNTGIPSLKKFFNSTYTNKDVVEIENLETAFTTHCNLACRMCNEDFSSKWKLINNPSLRTVIDTEGSVLEYYDIDLSKLKRIKMVGGEPFLHKQHLQLLDKLTGNNVVLQYHTNGTIFPNDKILDRWKSAKEIIIYFSIDGIDDIANYARPGNSWDNIKSNIQQFQDLAQQYGNIVLKSHTVVSVLNAMHILDMQDFLHTQFGDDCHFEMLEYPLHLNIIHQNKNTKSKIKNILSNYIPSTRHSAEFQCTMSNVVDIIIKKIDSNTSTGFTMKQIEDLESTLDVFFKQSFTQSSSP
jgi:molybdenum cofactor biosynthesis enzyme MoaA